MKPEYTPPWWLQFGLTMTLYTALRASKTWEKYTSEPEIEYREHLFTGHNGVPIFGLVAIPPHAKGTIVATYGITGSLDNQWLLRILGRKAYDRGYAVVLFDWRAHGKTAQLSPILTSDGIHEGDDFVEIARQSLKLGCPAPIWLVGYSLGGQLALWGVKAAQEVPEIAGGATICPSVESNRSLTYLVQHPIGKYLEQAIAKELGKMAWQLYEYHPQHFDRATIDQAKSIWGFDEALVISRLGFATVDEYYQATSPLYFLPQLAKPTLIIYAADDPLFDPRLIPDLLAATHKHPYIDLLLTEYGGHIGYISSKSCQTAYRDRDRWWAWNRVIEWIEAQ